MDEKENKPMDKSTEPTTTEPTDKQRGPQFIPRMLGQKVLCRMVDGRPLSAILSGYNPYEIVFDLGHNKRMLVFKHAISSIEFVESGEDRGGPGSFR
jgi:sRNA-binding regulator protein Hfq